MNHKLVALAVTVLPAASGAQTFRVAPAARPIMGAPAALAAPLAAPAAAASFAAPAALAAAALPAPAAAAPSAKQGLVALGAALADPKGAPPASALNASFDRAVSRPLSQLPEDSRELSSAEAQFHTAMLQVRVPEGRDVADFIRELAAALKADYGIVVDESFPPIPMPDKTYIIRVRVPKANVEKVAKDPRAKTWSDPHTQPVKGAARPR